MKKLLIILFSLGLGLGASAQYHGGIAGRATVVRPRIIIGGYLPVSPFLGWGYGLNPYFGYPPYANPYYNSRPSKLDLQIEDIRHDYKDRISSVKQDKSLSRQERKDKVKALKRERDNAVSNAKRNYHNTPVSNSRYRS